MIRGVLVITDPDSPFFQEKDVITSASLPIQCSELGRGRDGEQMKEVIHISPRAGLHNTTPGIFSKYGTIINSKSDYIFVEKDGERINGKSIMGLMMLAAGPGSRLVIEATAGSYSRRL